MIPLWRLPLKKCPLPLIVTIRREWNGASVDIYCDPTSKMGGAVTASGLLRPSCNPFVRKEFYNWIMIQAERKRMGLPFLESEEMIILHLTP